MSSLWIPEGVDPEFWACPALFLDFCPSDPLTYEPCLFTAAALKRATVRRQPAEGQLSANSISLTGREGAAQRGDASDIHIVLADWFPSRSWLSTEMPCVGDMNHRYALTWFIYNSKSKASCPHPQA